MSFFHLKHKMICATVDETVKLGRKPTNLLNKRLILTICFMVSPFVKDTGYPHDGRADNAAYRHDHHADKRR